MWFKWKKLYNYVSACINVYMDNEHIRLVIIVIVYNYYNINVLVSVFVETAAPN